MTKKVSKEELKDVLVVLAYFRKDESMRLEVCTMEFFIGFNDLLEQELLRLMDDIKRLGKDLRAFNSTFISLIPKKDSP